MSLISNKLTEHCVDGIVVSQRVIKLFGLPIYTKLTETTNYTYVSQFCVDNFQSIDETGSPKLYTETNIGFHKDEEKTK